ncbi:MAG: hypothetical protein FWC54_04035 [Actinomycetia bacterium]|nr:hypothetical protein [Actinomycetes bacterium]
MKKIFATTLATMLLLSSVAAPAFAAGGSITPSTSYTDIQGDSAQDATIPVYGYVGEDAVITDTDPSTPGSAPTVTPYEINVSVPVKIIWAAFQSNAPAITAPSYYIKNNSASNALDVTLSSFTARSTSANSAVDADLTLNLTGTEMAQAGIFNAGSGYTNTTAYTTIFDPQAQWDFSLSGTYTGLFNAAYNPVYDLVLTFALHI